MSLKLLCITNRPELAAIADDCGIDYIFVDLEIMGKEARQAGKNTVISRHTIADVRQVRKAIGRSKLLVRVNPIHASSAEEIQAVIDAGADVVMLPFFKTAEEVATFLGIINGRAKAWLLLETPEAVEGIDEILQLPGIDFVYIGLNDLHLGYKFKFMFEPLANGMIDRLGCRIKQAGIHFGFGGIAQLGGGLLPAELVLAEHYRLGSSAVILSRSFFNGSAAGDWDALRRGVFAGVGDIRNYESYLSRQPAPFFIDNQEKLRRAVAAIVQQGSH